MGIDITTAGAGVEGSKGLSGIADTVSHRRDGRSFASGTALPSRRSRACWAKDRCADHGCFSFRRLGCLELFGTPGCLELLFPPRSVSANFPRSPIPVRSPRRNRIVFRWYGIVGIVVKPRMSQQKPDVARNLCNISKGLIDPRFDKIIIRVVGSELSYIEHLVREVQAGAVTIPELKLLPLLYPRNRRLKLRTFLQFSLYC